MILNAHPILCFSFLTLVRVDQLNIKSSLWSEFSYCWSALRHLPTDLMFTVTDHFHPLRQKLVRAAPWICVKVTEMQLQALFVCDLSKARSITGDVLYNEPSVPLSQKTEGSHETWKSAVVTREFSLNVSGRWNVCCSAAKKPQQENVFMKYSAVILTQTLKKKVSRMNVFVKVISNNKSWFIP